MEGATLPSIISPIPDIKPIVETTVLPVPSHIQN